MSYPDFDIIIKFGKFDKAYGYLHYTLDGGNNWIHTNLYNDPHIVVQGIINRFAIFTVLNPNLNKGESLCRSCATSGKVGVVRYAGRISGTETHCVNAIDETGEFVAEDREFYCEYDQWKCQRCGYIAESDYA